MRPDRNDNFRRPIPLKEAVKLNRPIKTSVKNRPITSDFTQYKHLDFLSDDIESKGKLAFKAPDSGKMGIRRTL